MTGRPDPTDEYSAIFGAFERVAATLTQLDAEQQRLRRERRNSPEARARRSEAAKRGWQNRRERETAEDAADLDRYRPAPTGPTCDAMDIQPATGVEVSCERAPRHEGDCDDGTGHVWDHEPDCGCHDDDTPATTPEESTR